MLAAESGLPSSSSSAAAAAAATAANNGSSCYPSPCLSVGSPAVPVRYSDVVDHHPEVVERIEEVGEVISSSLLFSLKACGL